MFTPMSEEEIIIDQLEGSWEEEASEESSVGFNC